MENSPATARKCRHSPAIIDLDGGGVRTARRFCRCSALSWKSGDPRPCEWTVRSGCRGDQPSPNPFARWETSRTCAALRCRTSQSSAAVSATFSARAPLAGSASILTRRNRIPAGTARADAALRRGAAVRAESGRTHATAACPPREGGVRAVPVELIPLEPACRNATRRRGRAAQPRGGDPRSGDRSQPTPCSPAEDVPGARLARDRRRSCHRT